MESPSFSAASDAFDCDFPSADACPDGLSEAEDRKQRRLAYARRRKAEVFAAAEAAGKPIPRSMAKGESSIEFLLSKEQLDEYYALLRQPMTTLKVARAWLNQRGFPVGMDAVRQHRSNFRKREADQREAVELAFLFAETARSRGSACMADAAAAFVEQKVLISLMRGVTEQKEGEAFDAAHWQEIYKVIGGMTRARNTIEKIRLNEAKAANAAEQHVSRGVPAAPARELTTDQNASDDWVATQGRMPAEDDAQDAAGVPDEKSDAGMADPVGRAGEAEGVQEADDLATRGGRAEDAARASAGRAGRAAVGREDAVLAGRAVGADHPAGETRRSGRRRSADLQPSAAA
jgi:hypothetical protein